MIREAPGGVFLASAQSRFNCEKIWGRPGKESDAASVEHLNGALESKTPPVLLTEDACGLDTGTALRRRLTARRSGP